MEYRILGPLEVRDDQAAVEIGGTRQRTVLALLLLEAGRIVPTDRLVDGLWDEEPPATSRSQIHICISALRRRLSGDRGKFIDTRAPGYRLRVAGGELDLHSFEAHLAAARAAVKDGAPLRAAGELRSALALWSGPALAGIGSRLVRRAAAALDEKRLAAHEECLALELEHGSGAPQDLAGELAALVAAHPLRERPVALLMTALHRAGRQAEALEEYRRARERFTGELGIEPGEELRDLHQRVLTHDPALSRPAGLRPALVRSRGPRRLPADIEDFTGRRSSLARLLDAPEPQDGTAVPTAVISGRAGVGKTALAVHAAHRLAPEFPDGQLFARLSGPGAPARPEAVLGRFLRAYGVSDQDIPDGLEERAETYRDCLADRRVLIVLDDAVSESQVFPLLPGSSRCRVIVTSRRPLTGLPAAVRVGLAPLTESSALELMARIAGGARIGTDRQAALALCEACGHLPLALRLAAARLSTHPHRTAGDLAARLHGDARWTEELLDRTGARHTYAGLSAEARRLFRLLPLIEAADFAPWAGAPLLDTGVAQSEALLDELAEAHLLDIRPHPTGTRYWLPGWIRGFARGLLAAEEPEVSRRKALERLLGALLFLSAEAHRRLGGHHLHLAGNGASRWELPVPLVERLIGDPAGWYRQERSWVLAAVRQATAGGFPEHAWGLAMCTVTLLELPARQEPAVFCPPR
ncbi:AfsR/SARP family transcriptional regulator [Streptomyces aidingensis]|uniref:DNA-binding transcriptional activator of the SARP family n=1 Tax=Streptomyces aidingensis TaxID=910347 RepID=A0A1I1T4C9_9ACTN|nr:AfsR/SARP family transcriptional regulator [Streptomyces aidingensis]SFD53469.1 DNA-binding transcriptional activator of the SARP family [Streptomyces aidingensis]